MSGERTYLCIDLKSFYASVECVERRLDPLTTRLVVANPTRTNKTICLAVSPAMKKLGVSARCRVFEIPQGIDYLMAPPRMALYIEYARRVYEVYLRYVAAEDIHIYSIDEVFMDITDYYRLRSGSPKAFAMEILHEVYTATGLTATCGVGSNLYLAKIALDISSKHAASHIGVLTEETTGASSGGTGRSRTSGASGAERPSVCSGSGSTRWRASPGRTRSCSTKPSASTPSC